MTAEMSATAQLLLSYSFWAGFGAGASMGALVVGAAWWVHAHPWRRPKTDEARTPPRTDERAVTPWKG